MSGRSSAMISVLLLVVSIISLSSQSGAATPIRIGVSVSTQPRTAYWSTVGYRVLQGLQLFASRTDFSANVTLDIREDYGNATIANSNYLDMLNGPTPANFFIGPTGSLLNNAVKASMIAYNRSMFAVNAANREYYADTKPFGPFYLSINPASEFFGQESLPIIRLSGAKTMVVIRANNMPFVTQICDGVIENAKRYGLQILQTYNVPSITVPPLPPNYNQMFFEAAQGAQQLQPDVVYFCDFTPASEKLLKIFRDELDYTPPMLYLGYLSMSEIARLKEPELFQYVTGTETMHPNAYVYGINSAPLLDWQDYRQAFRMLFPGEEPDGVSAFSFTAAHCLNRMIQQLNTLDENQVFINIHYSTCRTFFGDFSFDTSHRQVREPIVVQFQNLSLAQTEGLASIVGPYIYNPQANIIYPQPTWEERKLRIYDDSIDPRQTIEIVCMAIAGVLLAAYVVVLIIVLIFRHNPIIRSGQWVLLIPVIIGAILATLTPFVDRVEPIMAAGCYALVMVPFLGLFLQLTALGVKNWRIWYLFANKSLDIVGITDFRAIMIMFGAFLPYLVLIIIWSILAQAGINSVVIDPLRPLYNYNVCVYDPRSVVMGWIVLAISAAGCGYGFYISGRSSNVNAEDYNDGRASMICIYVAAILGAVVFAISLVISDRWLRYGLVNFFILVECATVVGILSFQRLMIWKNPNESSSTGGSGRISGTSRTNTRPTSSNSTTSNSSNSHHLAPSPRK